MRFVVPLLLLLQVCGSLDVHTLLLADLVPYHGEAQQRCGGGALDLLQMGASRRVTNTSMLDGTPRDAQKGEQSRVGKLAPATRTVAAADPIIPPSLSQPSSSLGRSAAQVTDPMRLSRMHRYEIALGIFIIVVVALASGRPMHHFRECCGGLGIAMENLQSLQAPQEGLAADESRLKLIVLLIASSLFCMGYNLGIIVGAIVQIQEDPRFSSMGSLAHGVLVSCMLAGACVGSASGIMADVVGRKKGLLAAQTAFVVAAPVMFMAPNILILAAGRTIAGVGVGIVSGLANMYICEIAPAANRGRLSGWAPFLGICGTLTAHVVSMLFMSLPNGGWRWQFGLLLVPASLVFLLQALCLPESPRWLLLRDRQSDARAALRGLFPSAGAEAISEELDKIAAGLLGDKASDHHIGFRTLFKEHRKCACLGVTINILQQVTGINVIVFFGPMILQLGGFKAFDAVLVNTMVTMIALVGGMANVVTVDWIGRRSVAIIGLCSMVVAHGLVGTAFFARAAGQQSQAWTGGIMLVGMLLFRSTFSFSLGPLPYIMTPELFPQEVRAAGVALSWAANWGTNFVVCMTFPIIEEVLTVAMGKNLGPALTFGIYAGCCVVALVAVVCLLPETRGLTLENVRI
mmetsp:Transcript_21079/g.44972  ORF Transcript_21079/g.44972 Transcript_21079/m.44972 type:complete len:632 (-) Transcript_21079:50-1945(-)